MASEHDASVRGGDEVSTSSTDNVPLGSILRKRRTLRSPLTKTAEPKKQKQAKPSKTFAAKPKRSLPQRCTILAFAELVNQYREAISAETWGILNRTAFGPMLQCFRDALVKESDCRKTEIDFEIIMHHFDKDRMVWPFGSSQLDLTAELLTVLFHLPITGGLSIIPVSKLDDREEQAAKLFPNCKCAIGPSRTEIKNLLASEIQKGKMADPKKVASTLLMYLFSTFFFSRTGINLTWDLVNVCVDVEQVNKYDWPKSILDFLFSGIKKYNKDKIEETVPKGRDTFQAKNTRQIQNP